MAKSKTILKHLLGMTLVLFTMASGLLIGAQSVRASLSDGPYEQMVLLSRIIDTIDRHSIYPKTLDELIFSAGVGMAESLDEHSSYYSDDEITEQHQNIESWSIGSGIEINQALIVVGLKPNGIASKAGLMIGDHIVALNDSSVLGYSPYNVGRIIKNAMGSDVVFEIERMSKNNVVINSKIRIGISEGTINDAYVVLLENQIIYLRIEKFGIDTSDLIKQELLKYEGAVEGVLVDLRENPGGYVEEGIKTLDLFINTGSLITLRKNLGNEQHNATDEIFVDVNVPMAVLINKNTASTSEIVAGSLQKSNRAKLFGANSHGKGTIQGVFRLTPQTSLKMTIGTYVFQDGAEITKAEPLVPDFPVLNHRISPKDTLINEINSSKINPEKKKQMLLLVDKLKPSSTQSAISWHNDFSERLKLDAQLSVAYDWLLKNE